MLLLADVPTVNRPLLSTVGEGGFCVLLTLHCTALCFGSDTPETLAESCCWAGGGPTFTSMALALPVMLTTANATFTVAVSHRVASAVLQAWTITSSLCVTGCAVKNPPLVIKPALFGFDKRVHVTGPALGVTVAVN